MRYEEKYKALLGLIIELVESVKGKTMSAQWEWLADTQPLAAKMIQHLSSVLYLSHGTNVEAVGQHQIAFTDHASVIVLIRASFETYLVFHHLFIAAPEWEDKKFRHTVWRLGGLLTRGKGPLVSEYAKKVIHNEKQIIESLRAKIKQFEAFNAGKRGFQEKALSGDWKLGMGWSALAVQASFHETYFRGVYGYLSDYAHSGGLSLVQISASDTAASQREHVESMLGVCMPIMSHFVFAYASLYAEAATVLAANPELEHLAAIYRFDAEDMASIYDPPVA